MVAVARTVKRKHWGYIIWLVAGGVIAVPEITAAIDGDAVPFTTISAMVGHLERLWDWVELIVVALIVFAVFSVVRVPAARGSAAGPSQLGRTPGGRLTARGAGTAPAGPDATAEPAAAGAPQPAFDDDDASSAFAFAAIASFAVVGVATWAAKQWWDDRTHYHPAYVLYGLIALLWLVVPGVIAFGWGRDLSFPTMFRSVTNLEDWLRGKSWPFALGPLLAWLLAYVILAGLVILLLHLTLYPYPSITKIINPHG